MQFNINEWRKIYDRVHAIGQLLKDSRIDKDGNPAVNPLGYDTKRNLDAEIINLLDRCNDYLDSCNMRLPEPLWHYDKEDPKTHASHESFKYGHFLEH